MKDDGREKERQQTKKKKGRENKHREESNKHTLPPTPQGRHTATPGRSVRLAYAPALSNTRTHTVSLLSHTHRALTRTHMHPDTETPTHTHVRASLRVHVGRAVGKAHAVRLRAGRRILAVQHIVRAGRMRAHLGLEERGGRLHLNVRMQEGMMNRMHGAKTNKKKN